MVQVFQKRIFYHHFTNNDEWSNFSFGAGHDVPTSNGCVADTGVEQFVMAPQIASLSVPVVWSKCSKQKITEFLEYVESN